MDRLFFSIGCALGFTGVRSLGIVTPLGGIALLLGWLCLLAAPWRASR